MKLFGTTMLWWFFVAIGMGLFGTSYMALKMFSAGNIGGGLLFGIGFCFGLFKTYEICNDVLADSLTRTILSILPFLSSLEWSMSSLNEDAHKPL